MTGGFLNVYKPPGWTSHDVVARLRGILKTSRVGHTGTLDPGAEGVLLVAWGQATRLIPYLENQDKTYEAEIVFGLMTTTEDLEGEVIRQETVRQEQVENFPRVLLARTGPQEQVPPMYSAISIGGKRLYKLARKGVVVERPARPVVIREIILLQEALPEEEGRFRARFRVTCSPGTYVRSLCRDLGEDLGLPAVMGHLVRTAVGHHRVEDSVTLSQLEQEGAGDFTIFPEQELSHLPGRTLREDEEKKVLHGSSIALDNGDLAETGDILMLFSPDGRFLAVAEVRQEGQNRYLKMRKVFGVETDQKKQSHL